MITNQSTTKGSQTLLCKKHSKLCKVVCKSLKCLNRLLCEVCEKEHFDLCHSQSIADV